MKRWRERGAEGVLVEDNELVSGGGGDDLPLSSPRVAGRWGCLKPLPACEVQPSAARPRDLRVHCRRPSTWPRPPKAAGFRSRQPVACWSWSAEATSMRHQVEGWEHWEPCLEERMYLSDRCSNWSQSRLIDAKQDQAVVVVPGLSWSKRFRVQLLLPANISREPWCQGTQKKNGG